MNLSILNRSNDEGENDNLIATDNVIREHEVVVRIETKTRKYKVHGELGRGEFGIVYLIYQNNVLVNKEPVEPPADATHVPFAKSDKCEILSNSINIENDENKLKLNPKITYYAMKELKLKKMKHVTFQRGLTKRSKDPMEYALTEVKIMSQLAHKHIVNLIDVVVETASPYSIFCIMEFVDWGPVMRLRAAEVDGFSIKSILNMTYTNDKSNYPTFYSPLTGNTLGESYASKVYNGIVKAMAYMHSKHIAHRDLKPENILVDRFGTAKVADFGVAHHFETSKCFAHDTAGTWCFWSPEMCDESKAEDSYSPYAADVWASGVCLYIFIYGTVPFYAKQPTELFHQIVHESIYPLPTQRRLSPELADVFYAIFNDESKRFPEYRVSFKSMLRSPGEVANSLVWIHHQTNVESHDSYSELSSPCHGDPIDSSNSINQCNSFDVNEVGIDFHTVATPVAHLSLREEKNYAHRFEQSVNESRCDIAKNCGFVEVFTTPPTNYQTTQNMENQSVCATATMPGTQGSSNINDFMDALRTVPSAEDLHNPRSIKNAFSKHQMNGVEKNSNMLPKYKQKGLTLSRIDTGNFNKGVGEPTSAYTPVGLEGLDIHILGGVEDYCKSSHEKYQPAKDGTDTLKDAGLHISPQVQTILHHKGQIAKDQMQQREDLINSNIELELQKSHAIYMEHVGAELDATEIVSQAESDMSTSSVCKMHNDDISNIKAQDDTLEINSSASNGQCCCVQ